MSNKKGSENKSESEVYLVDSRESYPERIQVQ